MLGANIPPTCDYSGFIMSYSLFFFSYSLDYQFIAKTIAGCEPVARGRENRVSSKMQSHVLVELGARGTGTVASPSGRLP